MTFRLKVTKTNGREYAAIVEDFYNKKTKGSTSKTFKSYYKVRQAGINISNNMLIDCLKKADLSILKSDEDDNIIFMRQSVGTDLAKNNEMFQLQDKLLSVFKINRLSMCEDVITLENKFKVSHKLQLNY